MTPLYFAYISIWGGGGGVGFLEPFRMLSNQDRKEDKGQPPEHHPTGIGLFLTVEVFLLRKLRSLELQGSISTSASGGPAAH